ncbi:GNAT family N-acetyltransferase [Paraburkholderia domus]|uniref:GNAT family N-acetyltransferase n=1 Tax=Paraburkholderia domus TaxID=2793075 RepID=UPI0022A82048|nr:GNAT family N-acetyltransferase [Paraburkholderia domus]
MPSVSPRRCYPVTIYPNSLPGNAKCPKEIACPASHRVVQKNLNGPGEALTHGTLLDCLHVLATHQGREAGQLMIDAARKWTKEQNQNLMHLYVLDANAPAIAFYERNGWRFAGIEAGYIDATPVIDRRYVIDV